MVGSRSHVPIAASSVYTDTLEARGFFRDRLAIFGLWNGLLSFSFLPLRLALEYASEPSFTWRGAILHPGTAAHVVASGAAFAAWLAARSAPPLALRTLLWIDAAVAICIGAAFAAMGAVLASTRTVLIDDPWVGALTVTLAVSLSLIWRAVVVPGSPQRTAAVTGAAMLPLLIVDLVTITDLRATSPARLAAGPFSMLWLLVAFAIAVVASSVVFGLRREVQRVRRLGQYTLQEKIGEGAMGIVYRAQHAMLRRPTAIKLLQPSRAGQRNLERFEREVQLTALLTHPNTVAIYDYGRTPDGMFYYAMEYLDGIDLELLVRQYGAQPVGRVIHVVRQVCRALAEAHGIGVIHRDIKPANIILGVRGGEPDVAKVVDFGLVKAVDMNDTAITMSLDAGPTLVGTPLYFSPEAILSPDAADARSDLYALAAVAYYLVTGAPLFEGRSVMEICAQHLHAAPVRPSERLGRPLPADFEALLLQALSKSPDERPPDARAFEAALQACAAASPWTPDDASRWWDRYQAARAEARDGSEKPTGTETIAVDLSARP